LKANKAIGIGLTTVMLLASSGCASVRSFLCLDNASNGTSTPIHDPFGAYAANPKDRSENIILRTKKGDRSLEIELPRGSQQMTDFTIPMGPAFRNPASVAAGDTRPTLTDREITHAFPQAPGEQEGDRHSIEQGLGLMPSDDNAPEHDQSYLTALDRLKGLYRTGRYEAGLVENDNLIRQYPTDPRLHQMRGTLLDRIGQTDLAMKSWNQALRLNPKNTVLRKFIERREQNRSLASP
jgi:tetratricopeptide (TPR) repeat protein